MQVLIVDANAKSAELLRGRLSEITDSDIRCFRKSSEALIDVEEGLLNPEVCFIDLCPKEGAKAGKTTSAFENADVEGIALAHMLRQMLPGVQIIFMSEHDEYYLKSYEVDHVWFLRKPIDGLLLRKAWNRAMERLSQWERRSFTFRFDRKVYQIPLRDILFFEKDRRRVILHTIDQDYCFYGTMDELMAQLDKRFIRCHNSYLVNLTRIDTWSKSSFTIKRYKIPISRRYAKAAKAAFLDAQVDQMLHEKG